MLSGSANASSRAAMFTPSPYKSLPSTITSPRLIPTRSTIRRSRDMPSLAVAIASCNSTAQWTAFTALPNSARAPSPISLTMRPRCLETTG